MWTQIVGKTRLALAPKENHWWHVPLYVSARGLSTTAMPYRWGAFEVALTRFSGRRAPEPTDTASSMMREAMSHEEISVGFWPGSGAVPEPAFYAYVRPEPPGFGATAIRPKAAYYSRELADFILPYDAVRSASSPDEAVLD